MPLVAFNIQEDRNLNMQYIVRRITNGPKHHLFGFHDLVQTNAKGDLALSLEVDDISHPPLPGETCKFGVVPAEGGEFIPIHATHTWNYPQGARQQWVGDGDLFTCNDRDDKGNVFAWIADGRIGETIDKLPFPVHCIDSTRRLAFWFDYDRVYSCGGYGYCPLCNCSKHRLVDIPCDGGIWAGNLKTGDFDLLASLEDVASCGEKRPVRTGFPHYVTHFMLSPSGKRMAFLHRYRVPDGGETTRLMTIGTDGGTMRCLAKGFLSHFTWISDDELIIWGENQPAISAMREATYLRIPGVLQSAMVAKKLIRLVRILRGWHAVNSQNGASLSQSKAFLRIRDASESCVEKIAVGFLTEDGHPMANPRALTLLVSDTYPHADGKRTLMFYDIHTEKRINVGMFQMIPNKPNPDSFDLNAAQSGMDSRVLKKSDMRLYLFARSGFHCDLHPRWSYDGKAAFFDSIHEGTRQIYRVDFQ